MSDASAAQPLAPGHLACGWCGQGVRIEPGTPTEEVYIVGRWVEQPVPRVRPISPVRGRLASCGECGARRERAVALLAEHPRVASSIGSEDVAADRVDAAFAALELVGQPAPPVGSDADLARLVARMASAGAAARWAQRLAPVIERGADPGTCAPSRWAHVGPQQRQAARDGFARLMHDRLDHPAPVPVPEGGPPGCLYCGLGVVSVLVSRAADAWHEHVVWPESLGGRAQPHLMSGYLCSTCDAAVAEVGSFGPSSMEESVRRHLGVERVSMQQATLVGLIGWGALGRSKPNPSPWHHVANLRALAREMS